jgi:hypothetical protein
LEKPVYSTYLMARIGVTPKGKIGTGVSCEGRDKEVPATKCERGSSV